MCNCDCEMEKREKWQYIEMARNLEIAHRIRAELVCCDIYDRLQDEMEHETNINPIGRAILRDEWHGICYWGEAAAKLAETYGEE